MVQWTKYKDLSVWWGYRTGPLRNHEGYERRAHLGGSQPWGRELQYVTAPVMRSIDQGRLEPVDSLEHILTEEKSVTQARAFVREYLTEYPEARALLTELRAELRGEGAHELAHLVDIVLALG